MLDAEPDEGCRFLRQMAVLAPVGGTFSHDGTSGGVQAMPGGASRKRRAFDWIIEITSIASTKSLYADSSSGLGVPRFAFCRSTSIFACSSWSAQVNETKRKPRCERVGNEFEKAIETTDGAHAQNIPQIRFGRLHRVHHCWRAFPRRTRQLDWHTQERLPGRGDREPDADRRQCARPRPGRPEHGLDDPGPAKAEGTDEIPADGSLSDTGILYSCCLERSDVAESVIGHGKVEGPSTEIDGLANERDDRYPIRVPVQFCGSSQKYCNTIEVTHGKERGQTPFVAAPCGPFRQKGSVPFSTTKLCLAQWGRPTRYR